MKVITILAKMLRNAADNLDSGNCNLSDEEAMEVMNKLEGLVVGNAHMSMYQTCKYLNISKSTLYRYIGEGILPKGKHVPGFKEVMWSKTDLDKAIREKL